MVNDCVAFIAGNDDDAESTDVILRSFTTKNLFLGADEKIRRTYHVTGQLVFSA
jgi:hypothetical protein